MINYDEDFHPTEVPIARRTRKHISRKNWPYTDWWHYRWLDACHSEDVAYYASYRRMARSIQFTRLELHRKPT